jgi:hypothetical protein
MTTYLVSRNIVTQGRSKEFRLFPERLYQPWPAAHPAQRLPGGSGQLGEVLWAQIGQLMLFAVTPDVFDWIEFGCISGQILQMNVPILSGHKLAHQATAVDGQPVPDDQELGANMPLEVFQKLDHLRSLDAPREEPEVEVPDRNPRYGRKALPVERILQDRSLATRSPSADPVRAFAQTALVHKDYGALLAQGLFFNSGQRTRFQRRMADSSRWMARPVGRWQLHPKERNIRHTCPG